MKLTRTLAALFLTASLSLAAFVPLPSGNRTLLAAASECGAFDGPLCKETTSCVWYLFARICTTTYDYYNVESSPDDGGDSDTDQPELTP